MRSVIPGIPIPKFGVIPTAEYDVNILNLKETALSKKLVIAEAEPKDLPAVEGLVKQLHQLRLIPLDQNIYRYVSHGLNLKKALSDVKALLQLKKSNFPKELSEQAKIWFAICEGEICGVAVANIPKLKSDKSVTQSKRNRSDETELDWIVTWPLKGAGKIKGAGQILLAHVYDALETLSVKRMYIRAENAKYSDAIKFFKAMGCHAIDKEIPYETEEGPFEITKILDIKAYTPHTTLVMPMEIDVDMASEKKKKIFEKYHQKRINPSYASETVADHSSQPTQKTELQPFSIGNFLKKLVLKRYLNEVSA